MLFLQYLVCGPLEADPEYQLIVEANNVTVEIDSEISKCHYFLNINYRDFTSSTYYFLCLCAYHMLQYSILCYINVHIPNVSHVT